VQQMSTSRACAPAVLHQQAHHSARQSPIHPTPLWLCCHMRLLPAGVLTASGSEDHHTATTSLLLHPSAAPTSTYSAATLGAAPSPACSPAAQAVSPITALLSPTDLNHRATGPRW